MEKRVANLFVTSGLLLAGNARACERETSTFWTTSATRSVKPKVDLREARSVSGAVLFPSREDNRRAKAMIRGFAMLSDDQRV